MTHIAKCFISPIITYQTASLVLAPGIFILNLVTRDEKLRETALSNVKQAFTTVISYKLEEDVNEILFCQNGEHDVNEWKQRMEASVDNVNKILSVQTGARTDQIDVHEFLKELKL